MKSKLKIKLIILLNLMFALLVVFSMPSFAIWCTTKKGDIYWVDKDNTFPKDGWKMIDEDEDGVGYYYYFDKNGYLVIDDITPDYMVVNLEGKRIDYDGKPVTVKIEEIKLEEVGESEDVYSEEILEQIKAQQSDATVVDSGHKSSGTALFALDMETQDGPKPSDNIVIEKNADGTARTILGPNVVLKKEKNKGYDVSIDRKMQSWVVGGSKYSKKTNGTTFTKSKWKDCMSLQGTGAMIKFENPSNNFNTLKGRIATVKISDSDTDRTTECTLIIYNDETNEDILTVSGFDYSAGTNFSAIFPRKLKTIRFELDVQGKTTSRTCYLRDCVFGFDKEAYEEELYEDESDRMYRENNDVGTSSDAEYVDYDDEDDEEIGAGGEQSVEGEDPGARYRRLNNINDDEYWAHFDYSDDDDTITEAMKASISEAKARLAARDEANDNVAGPAFDKTLQEAKEALDPLGGSRMYKGKEGG